MQTGLQGKVQREVHISRVQRRVLGKGGVKRGVKRAELGAVHGSV